MATGARVACDPPDRCRRRGDRGDAEPPGRRALPAPRRPRFVVGAHLDSRTSARPGQVAGTQNEAHLRRPDQAGVKVRVTSLSDPESGLQRASYHPYARHGRIPQPPWRHPRRSATSDFRRAWRFSVRRDSPNPGPDSMSASVIPSLYRTTRSPGRATLDHRSRDRPPRRRTQAVVSSSTSPLSRNSNPGGWPAIAKRSQWRLESSVPGTR